VAGVSLLGLAETADFEFHLASWLGGGERSRYQTVPEVERLAVPVTCVFGADESDSACRLLTGPHVKAVAVGRGHHFGDDYARVVEVILRRGR
jgi:type IV secretory pathway VirJ component